MSHVNRTKGVALFMCASANTKRKPALKAPPVTRRTNQKTTGRRTIAGLSTLLAAAGGVGLSASIAGAGTEDFDGFGMAEFFATGNEPRSVAIADLDGDGDNDLAVSNRGGDDDVSILLNNGDGTFESFTNISVGDQPHAIDASDLDGDGDVDLAVANQASDNVAVLLGIGDGNFSTPEFFPAGNFPKGVALGDLNGDSSPDLVTSNRDSSDVTVLLNQTDVLPPGEFDLLTPPDGTVGVPVPTSENASWLLGVALDWSVATGFSNTYTVIIANDPGLTDVVHQQSGLEETSLVIPPDALEAGSQFFWGVVAENQAGQTPSTPESFSFSTVSPADLNGDGQVNGADLGLLLGAWGEVD